MLLSLCWSMRRRSWELHMWWLVWISSNMTTRTSSATFSFLDFSHLLQGTSFNLLTLMLFVSSIPSKLSKSLFLNLCLSSDQKFIFCNRLSISQSANNRYYGNIHKNKKIKKKNKKKVSLYCHINLNDLKNLVFQMSFYDF